MVLGVATWPVSGPVSSAHVAVLLSSHVAEVGAVRVAVAVRLAVRIGNAAIAVHMRFLCTLLAEGIWA